MIVRRIVGADGGEVNSGGERHGASRRFLGSQSEEPAASAVPLTDYSSSSLAFARISRRNRDGIESLRLPHLMRLAARDIVRKS